MNLIYLLIKQQIIERKQFEFADKFQFMHERVLCFKKELRQFCFPCCEFAFSIKRNNALLQSSVTCDKFSKAASIRYIFCVLSTSRLSFRCNKIKIKKLTEPCMSKNHNKTKASSPHTTAVKKVTQRDEKKHLYVFFTHVTHLK